MKFDGKIISRDTFIQLLDEGLPSIQNYEWMKEKIIEKQYSSDDYVAVGCWKSGYKMFERCFCVVNEFKEALIFRYFMIRITRQDSIFREISRTAVLGDQVIELKNGRYWCSSAYEFRWSNYGDKFKIFKRSYYDTNYIYCELLSIDNAPRLKYVKIMLESATRSGFSNSLIETTIKSYLLHPKYEVLWKANGDKFAIIGHIDEFSNKKLVFIGKNKLEEYFEAVWCYDIYDPDFIRKIKASSKLENLIKKLKTYGINKYQLARFIKKQDAFDCSDYMDYLDNLKTLEIDVKANAFPKDYEEEHTRLSMQIQYIKQGPVIKEYGQKYIETMKSLLPLERTDKYSIVIPKRIEDFLREGQVQRICVFANGYYKSVIKHKSIILFVRTIDKPDKPYICVELDGLFNVVQARGFSNERAPKEVNDYLVDVTNEYKQMYGDLNNFWKKAGANYDQVYTATPSYV